jgi:hypothetical protein
MLPAQLGAGGFDSGGIAAAKGVHLDCGLKREEARGLAPGVGVGFAHEAVPNHADPESFGHKVGVEFAAVDFIVTPVSQVNGI